MIVQNPHVLAVSFPVRLAVLTSVVYFVDETASGCTNSVKGQATLYSSFLFLIFINNTAPLASLSYSKHPGNKKLFNNFAWSNMSSWMTELIFHINFCIYVIVCSLLVNHLNKIPL